MEAMENRRIKKGEKTTQRQFLDLNVLPTALGHVKGEQEKVGGGGGC